jgi:hypothetical protein
MLTITDANSCVSTGFAFVNEPACDVIITATYTEPLCYQGLGSITWVNSGGVAPYTNSLLSSDLNVPPVVDDQLYDSPSQPFNLPAEVYDLVVTDAAGCIMIENIALIEPSEFTASLILTDVNCFGGTDGTAGVDYSSGGWR